MRLVVHHGCIRCHRGPNRLRVAAAVGASHVMILNDRATNVFATVRLER